MSADVCVPVCAHESAGIWGFQRRVLELKFLVTVSSLCGLQELNTSPHALKSWLILSVPPSSIFFFSFLVCLSFVVSVSEIKPSLKHAKPELYLWALLPTPSFLNSLSHLLETVILKFSIHQTLLRTRLKRRVLGFRLWLISSSVRTRWNIFKNKYLHWFFHWAAFPWK